MRLNPYEIQTSTATTFRFAFFLRGLQLVPSAATATVYVDGTSVSTGAATISASGDVTYSILATDITTVTQNAKIVLTYTVGGVEYERVELFDAVPHPMTNTVSDDDLYHYAPLLKSDSFEDSYKCSSAGTTTTAICIGLTATGTNYEGGWVEIVDSSNALYRGRVTAYNSTTGELTFSPALPTATSVDDMVTVRSSYEETIQVAHQLVVADIRAVIGLAGRLIDATRLQNLTIYRALQIWFGNRIDEAGDRWEIQHERFAGLYSQALSSLPYAIDSDDDGDISDEEQKQGGRGSVLPVVM